MRRYSLSHLSDHTLLHDLAALVARDRATTAALLAHIAEVDARKLYLPAAYPSMFAYCVGELHLSEDAAFKRIQAARLARRVPAVFDAVAEGRLHLAAVCLLAPHLTASNADDLLAAATHQSKAGVERLLAARFPQLDLPVRLEAISSPLPVGPPAPDLVESPVREAQLAPGQVERPTSRPRLAPLSPERFALQLTIGQRTHDKLRHAQALLGHQLPSGDIAEVFERALDALIGQLEQRKFAATAQPRGGQRRASMNHRYVPTHVRRTVWERDGGQCTFVSEAGHRCPARTRLEFDHIQEVGRGGETSVAGIRLRCRAHNQYGAERTFGTEFMRHKRRVATEAKAVARARAEAEEKAAAAKKAAADRARERDVVPWLRQLGFNAGEARRAAALCEDMPDASLEERVRRALSFVSVRGVQVVRPAEGRTR